MNFFDIRLHKGYYLAVLIGHSFQIYKGIKDMDHSAVKQHIYDITEVEKFYRDYYLARMDKDSLKAFLNGLDMKFVLDRHLLIPEKPEKIIASSPAAMRVSGNPLKALGGSANSILALTPAKITIARVNPSPAAKP